MWDKTNLITNGTKDTPPRASATLPGHQPLEGIKNSLATEPELCNQSGLSQGPNKESEYHDSHDPMTKVDKPNPSHPSLEASHEGPNHCQEYHLSQITQVEGW